jgi:hypothetical protein
MGKTVLVMPEQQLWETQTPTLAEIDFGYRGVDVLMPTYSGHSRKPELEAAHTGGLFFFDPLRFL